MLRFTSVQSMYRLLTEQDLVGFFFFFQAEDGIRDLIVTGVQTCALPISVARRGQVHRDGVKAFALAHAEEQVESRPDSSIDTGIVSSIQSEHNTPRGNRSEERRVGKECRSRRSPYH